MEAPIRHEEGARVSNHHVPGIPIIKCGTKRFDGLDGDRDILLAPSRGRTKGEGLLNPLKGNFGA